MWSYRDCGTGQLPKTTAGWAMLNNVLLAAQHVNQVPQDVQQRLVRFLTAVNAETGDRETIVAKLRHSPAVATGEADRYHAYLTSRLERSIDTRGLAARGNAQRDVTGPPQHAHLLGEGQGKILIVAD